MDVYFSKTIDDDVLKSMMSRFDVTDENWAVKVHFGEKGNTRYVSPKLIKPILEEFSKKNNDHFLTDTNTLYRGKRLNATDHIELAMAHGFGELDIPIRIADGEHGDDEMDVPVDGDIFDEVKIGRLIAEAKGLLVISHFKGHILFGFGGALKNLGMGGGSRAGKLAMHSKIKPQIGASCISCGTCVENCASDAIVKTEKGYQITDACTGCAKCISVCPQGAIGVPWHGATSEEAQKRCAEYAMGAAKKAVYFNFIIDVTKDCDCLSDSDIIADDIGVLASTDPVALDQACYDLLKEKNGKDVFQEANGVDGTHIMKHAEKLGLGTREYRLVEV